VIQKSYRIAAHVRGPRGIQQGHSQKKSSKHIEMIIIAAPMKIRASLYLNGQEKQLVLFPVMQETTDHLLLKLAAAILFDRPDLILSPTLQHPALREQEFIPDLLHVNDQNEVTLWLECGKTTLHKMEKVAKRYRDARLVMLTDNPIEGRQIAENLPSEKWNRWEILSFQHGEFVRWRASVKESNDVMGEADERSMNLVVNEDVYVTELEKIR
jgi:hypothetical protein